METGQIHNALLPHPSCTKQTLFQSSLLPFIFPGNLEFFLVFFLVQDDSFAEDRNLLSSWFQPNLSPE